MEVDRTEPQQRDDRMSYLGEAAELLGCKLVDLFPKEPMHAINQETLTLI